MSVDKCLHNPQKDTMANKNFPEIKLRGLRAFVAVAEMGSVIDAARRLDGSSSGVSQQITALEAAVGTKLFDHSCRPMKLTAAGYMLRTHAYRILEAVSDAQADLSKHNLADLRKLTLAVIDDLDMSFTPALVSKVQERFQGCFVSVYSGRSDQVVGMLQHNEADICVSATYPDDVEVFRTIPIMREQFILVTAKGLLQQGDDILARLHQAPFVQYSDSVPIGRTITQHMRRLRLNFARKFALEASRSVIAMVVQTNGWALTTPLNLLDAERFVKQVDVLEVPFSAFSRQIYLVSRHAELGDLPDHLADDCRQLVAEQVIPRFANLVPKLAGTIEVSPR